MAPIPSHAGGSRRGSTDGRPQQQSEEFRRAAEAQRAAYLAALEERVEARRELARRTGGLVGSSGSGWGMLALLPYIV